MKQLTVYADPAAPDQRIYQIDDGVAEDAFMDMLDVFRGAAFRNDLGVDAPGRKPKHNIPGQLQAIEGVGQIVLSGSNYIVYRRAGVNWKVIDPQIRKVFALAFGKIKKVTIVEGSLS